MARFVYDPSDRDLGNFGYVRTVRGVTFGAGEPEEVTSEMLAAKLRCLAEFREVAEDVAPLEPIESPTACSGEHPGLQNQDGEARHLEAVPEPTKRKRGRPPGSKNKRLTDGSADEG